MGEENVMVFPAKMLEYAPVKGFQKAEDFHKEMPDALIENSYFMQRSAAEVDENWKQIIPYCIFECDGKILSYVRTKKAGENRLRGKGSIGIGGHVNDNDFEDPLNPTPKDFLEGLNREILEETGLVVDLSDIKPYGYIYDDSNEVGRVHFGVVYKLSVNEKSPIKTDESMADVNFLTLEELKTNIDSYENWSQLVISKME